jgi:hypothetical protein
VKAQIHINQHVIRRNGKTGQREPVIAAPTDAQLRKVNFDLSLKR